MVKIQIGDIEASIEHGQWTCENADIAEILTMASSTVQIAGSDPYPDATIARGAVDMLGGEVTQVDEPHFDKNVIY